MFLGQRPWIGGAITSAADADKNQITTGNLVANSLDNHSVWSGLNVNGSTTGTSQYTVAGPATEAKDHTLLPGNVLNSASALGVKGNVVTNDQHSTTDSVITSNVTVNTGSTTGKVANTLETGSGYLENNFDANQMQNNFSKQDNLTQQLTKIGDNITTVVVSQIDKKTPGDVAGDTATGNMVVSGIASVGGAALGKGDVGATAAGVVAGDLANSWATDASKQIADKISPDQKNPSDPNNGGAINNQGEKNTNIQGDITPNNNAQNEQNNNKQTYDTTTDMNKVVSSISHDLIVGGLGALSGIVTGSGNIGLDATAGGLTSLQQPVPKAEKPKDQKKDHLKDRYFIYFY
ncbi:hypothetical protein [Commensalibacter intestini]|uniref:hypothetical protein n=1 Tax=Commensalibacter intestini TaxID=479936 RepID=UPI0002E0B455|nr:hypothetical protein [Commensalibacter intestini]